MANKKRIDRTGSFRAEFERNRKKLLAYSDVCGICGLPLDKAKKYPHPMATVIDHIIPIDKGGHPYMMDNLQAAHNHCNRQKSNKIFLESKSAPDSKNHKIRNDDLPWTIDWLNYKWTEE